MAITTPPEITPAPLPAPQRGERATFKGRVDDFITWLTISVVQFAALAQNVYANALDAFASAGAAAGYRDEAVAFRDAAIAARDKALEYRDTAQQHRDNALAARDAAQNYALALTATSGTSHTVGAGSKTFTTQTGKQFTVGQVLYFVDPTQATRWMAGPVTAYSGTSLTVNFTDANAATSGQTGTSWNISIAGVKGVPGAAGGVTGGNLTGALNEQAATSIPSATALDIWSPAGNYIPVTGTATVTSFTPAPQAGADRTLIATAALVLTASDDLIIKGVQSGSTFTCAAGDEIDVRAETTTRFRVTVRRGDGTAMSALYGSFQNTRRIKSTEAFVARRTGWHRVTVIGGGGRGAIAQGGSGLAPKATGGGAGGFAVGMRFLVAGTSYTALVGARLGSLTSTNGSIVTQGAAGNAATFSGPNIIPITGNGGGAGVAVNTAGVPAAGAVGGTATGGDINVTGGGSGAITDLQANCAAATGGGAAGLQGIGYSSGSISIPAGTSTVRAATGGASVGGASAGFTAGSSATTALTGGGGAGGPSTSNIGGTVNAGGPNFDGVAAGAPAPIQQGVFVLFNQTAGGTNSGVVSGGPSGDAANGGGSGAAYGGNSGNCNFSCAGSGGVVSTGGDSSGAVNDFGGGGSGGIATTSASACTAGQPAGALIQIEW